MDRQRGLAELPTLYKVMVHGYDVWERCVEIYGNSRFRAVYVVDQEENWHRTSNGKQDTRSTTTKKVKRSSLYPYLSICSHGPQLVKGYDRRNKK